jgi:hypothetical protein
VASNRHWWCNNKEHIFSPETPDGVSFGQVETELILKHISISVVSFTPAF